MLYIKDNLNSLIRSHPRWNSPQSVSGENATHYADKFKTRKDAEAALSYWKHNNDFKGEVIDRDAALAIEAKECEALYAEQKGR